ncbi:phosphotriesterase [Arundinibacter roseus]|uniref:Phosphotriesterase n=2 Tax=Arundinibacter roseus TaxID=2070510 RepID=A0A4R4K9Z6_9BACT|nr:phosphotriesterase [Arundinibacter roseus]
MDFSGRVMTVEGPKAAGSLGKTLIHEHFLVDFIGADKISATRWNRQTVRKAVAPYIEKAKSEGIQSIMDCTPAFLGRDVHLLREISREHTIHILTNTGYYGAVNNKYLPKWAFTETEQQLADRWIREFENGIEGTDIRPGFIKIGVDSGKLSELHKKLVRAAAITHLATGLTICSHTGPAPAAFEQIELIKKMGVRPDAFVWVHAQAEPDKNIYPKAAQMGAWVSLDGMGWGEFEGYATWLSQLKSEELLNRVLISHDAGWYTPGTNNSMKSFVGYTNFFEKIQPILRSNGWKNSDFDQLLIKNPEEAFTIAIRKL